MRLVFQYKDFGSEEIEEFPDYVQQQVWEPEKRKILENIANSKYLK
jgi:hypothetical protein